MNETSIKAKIQTDLKENGWIVIRFRAVEGSGWPDVLALKNKQVLFIETKTPIGVLSELQKLRHNQLKKEGFEVLTLSSLKQLQEWKLLPKNLHYHRKK